MIALHDINVMLALSDYRAAVQTSEHAKHYGTHGDGRVTAALRAERDAYHAVLALTAPELLESIVADEVSEAAHRDATAAMAGLRNVDNAFALVTTAVQR